MRGYSNWQNDQGEAGGALVNEKAVEIISGLFVIDLEVLYSALICLQVSMHTSTQTICTEVRISGVDTLMLSGHRVKSISVDCRDSLAVEDST